MNLLWHGQSFFEIGVKNGKETETKIVIDPFEGDFVGLKFPKTEADIVLISHDHKDHSNVKAVGGTPFVIDTPGEYEVKDIFIKGIPAFRSEREHSRNSQYSRPAEYISAVAPTAFSRPMTSH